ncbi:UbiA family prenyltransferase [Allorhodopirellula heiligendammensis]|uniref:Prenyltransferase n=1 Tax=Allorhodopirellula heiligendammensis TaxID=2714739 RepID=A0A5C6BYB6_9BACT|nr:UbiA family prenyltransferase [Allorhodopirellula heiligendammensis]TWU16822.1 prenyltransferase [Allorhodopirellula heiligendammensis]
MSKVNWMSWAELVRLPNTFTIIADISAAFLLVLGGSGWYTGALGRVASDSDQRDIWIVLGLTLVSAVSLYWAGMILNDVFDLRRDVRARRGRPLARRAISVRSAQCAGWGLLVCGVIPPIAVGICCDSRIGWVPAVVAVILSICIVLYDGPLKRTPLAPLLMGACRTLSFSLGAASASAVLSKFVSEETLASLQSIALGDPLAWGFTPVVCAFAMGMGMYIAGLTTFGRREAVGDRTIHLPVGLVMMAVGAVMLAFAPRTAAWSSIGEGNAWEDAWRIDPVVIFPAAILLMLATALLRGFAAARNPSPQRIGATIGSGLMAIIPLAATITMLAVGANIAVLIFALLIPSRLLASRFRMT